MGNEEGQGLVEYAVLLMLIALVIIVIVFVLGGGVANMYQNIVTSIPK